MVQGIEKFKAEFSQFSSQYVLIGGTACSILLEERNLIELKNNPVDLKSLRINNIHYKDIIERIENCFY